METKNKSNIGIILLFLFIGLVVGFGSSFILTNVLGDSKESNKSGNKTESVVSNKVETYNPVREEALNVDGLFVNELIDRYGKNDPNLMSILYNRKIITPNDLGADFLKKIIAIDANKSLMSPYFTQDDFSRSKTKLFGSKFGFMAQADIDLGCGNMIVKSDDVYSFKRNPNSACGGMDTRVLLRKIMSAKKTDDGIVIVVAAGTITLEKKVYRDPNLTDQVDVTVIDGPNIGSFNSYIADEDYSKLYQFEYIFKYDVNNNNYYLEMIKPVN